MKKFLVLLAVLVFYIPLTAQRLVILHTNDMHSKITGYGPESQYTPLSLNDDKTLGGFARLASVVKKERSQNPNSFLLLDAGDFLMGTLFHTLEPKTGFQLNMMKQLGYDAITFGNHEFDFGTAPLADVIISAKKRGGVPPIVAANLKFSKSNKDDKLQNLYENGVIKPYIIIKKNGLKIGIFGLLGYNAIEDIKNASPLQFYDPIKTAKKYTKILRKKEKVDIIICLSHSGIYPKDDGSGYYGEDIKMAKKVKDIDIIISGHTHVETPQYIQVGKTIIVQTGCYLHNVGRLEIEYKNGKVNVLNFRLIPLNDSILGDKKINDQITKYEHLIEERILRRYALSYKEPIAELGFDIPLSSHKKPFPTPLGNLVADAEKYYLDNYADSTDIYITASGTLRENLFKGQITPPDAFRVLSLGFGKNDYEGYPIVKAYLTAHEIKQIMEIAYISNDPGSDSYLYFSGVKAYYNPNKGFLHKIVKLEIGGKPVDFSRKNKKLYSVATNYYIMQFVGKIKKLSYGLVRVYTKNKQGEKISDVNKMIVDFNKREPGVQEGKEWFGLIKYLQTFKDTDGDGISNVPDSYKKFAPYLIPVNSEK